MQADPGLTRALQEIVDKIDANLRASDYRGEPVRMVIAGGIAMHHYSQVRVTFDVDATFSRRLALPFSELTAPFQANGKPALLYLDANYNPAFALMHRDFEADAREWQGLNRPASMVKVYVLSPVDLALSKVSRFSEQDRHDIKTLARLRLFTLDELRRRASEALEYYIGKKTELECNLKGVYTNVTTIRGECPPGSEPGVRI